MFWGRPGGFEQERGEEHPPETASANEKRTENPAGDSKPGVKKDILEEGLSKGKSQKEPEVSLPKLLERPGGEAQNKNTCQHEARSGKQEAHGERLVVPQTKDIFDAGKSAAPHERAYEDEKGKGAKRDFNRCQGLPSKVAVT